MVIRNRNRDGQGMKWIRSEKRLAIYMRDGLACAWCGASIEDGVQLTLDHIIPQSKGGSNHEGNLVTCCKPCNDSRGNRSPRAFANAVARYLDHGVTSSQILAHVRKTRLYSLNINAAKKLIASRGGFVAACRKASQS